MGEAENSHSKIRKHARLCQKRKCAENLLNRYLRKLKEVKHVEEQAAHWSLAQPTYLATVKHRSPD